MTNNITLRNIALARFSQIEIEVGTMSKVY